MCLFEIGSKFRDEKRPRYGIIRGREFIMKDLYTFDTSEESSKATYNQVCEIYDELFNEIGIPYQKGKTIFILLRAFPTNVALSQS